MPELTQSHVGVSGGWAVEAFTGLPRTHGDLDLEVPRIDLPRLRRHLAGRLDLWTADSGALAPLLPDDEVDAEPATVLPAGCGQLWTRPSGTEPWEYDVPLMTGDHETWVFERDDHVRRPLADVGWTAGGVPYLRPEVQILLTACGPRGKDQADFDAAGPLLDPTAVDWLRSLELVDPGHPWLATL